MKLLEKEKAMELDRYQKNKLAEYRRNLKDLLGHCNLIKIKETKEQAKRDALYEVDKVISSLEGIRTNIINYI